MLAICVWCGLEFTRKNYKNVRTHKFCSRKCCVQDFYSRNPNARKGYEEKRKEQWRNRPLPCKGCKNDIPKERRGGGVLYCSVQCREEFRRKKLADNSFLKRREFMELKESKGCSKCGYNRFGGSLDFHHPDPSVKKRRIFCHSWENEVSKEEMEKCQLLCKNCHYEEHYRMRNQAILD
jgi:hypothetical protein